MGEEERGWGREVQIENGKIEERRPKEKKDQP
jgi:hypothetical protein